MYFWFNQVFFYFLQETDNSDIKSLTWQDTEIEEDMPTLSPQICLENQEQGAK